MPISEVRPLTSSTQVRDMLRDRIISGDLEPGERLTETDLAKRLKVSRGPLREAILQHTEEGLLVKAPYKGLRVRSVSQRELAELYSMRITLERFAFEQAWDRRTPDTLGELQSRFKAIEDARAKKDLSRAVEGEVAFHSWIYELSQNSILLSYWKKLTPLVQIYMSIHQKRHAVSGVFMAANHTYLTLARGDDLEAMLRHIADHMQKGLEEVFACVPEH